jgi:glycerate kinase
MRILIAPDSFKGTFTSAHAAQLIQAGLRNINPKLDCVCFPLADGGEGTLDVLVDALAGRLKTTQVLDPSGNTREARYGLVENNQTAVVEVAEAIGLNHVTPPKRTPWNFSSFGAGQLLRAALDEQITRIIIGTGGTATNDGGAGLLQGLGVKFLDRENNPLPQFVKPRDLISVRKAEVTDLKRLLSGVSVEVGHDVDNPLLGRNGATSVFGPQKGIKVEEVSKFESVLSHYSEVIGKATGKKDATTPGAGSAGGIGFSLVSVLEAKMSPGAHLVMDLSDFKNQARNVDLVITGEGKIDHQTFQGKAISRIADVIKPYEIPLVAIGGVIEEDVIKSLRKQFNYFVETTSSKTPSHSINQHQAQKNLFNAAGKIARWLETI